jgi:hypothetical protein
MEIEGSQWRNQSLLNCSFIEVKARRPLLVLVLVIALIAKTIEHCEPDSVIQHESILYIAN